MAAAATMAEARSGQSLRRHVWRLHRDWVLLEHRRALLPAQDEHLQAVPSVDVAERLWKRRREPRHSVVSWWNWPAAEARAPSACIGERLRARRNSEPSHAHQPRGHEPRGRAACRLTVPARDVCRRCRAQAELQERQALDLPSGGERARRRGRRAAVRGRGGRGQRRRDAQKGARNEPRSREKRAAPCESESAAAARKRAAVAARDCAAPCAASRRLALGRCASARGPRRPGAATTTAPCAGRRAVRSGSHRRRRPRRW